MRDIKFICNKDINFILIYDIVITYLELGVGFCDPWVGALKQGWCPKCCNHCEARLE